MSDAQSRPSEEELWSGPMGEKWLAHVDQFEGMIAPIGAALIARARFIPGEHVLDVGCGAGATTIGIAPLVLPGGSVTGLDISPVLVEAARKRASKASLENVELMLGDAAVAGIEKGAFDCLFSRFGTMFFHDPAAAFGHLHGCLKPTGRLVLACWGSPAENRWMIELRAVLARYVEMPAPVPHAPGPFAYDDPDYLRDILVRAGFHTPAFTKWEGEQPVGGPGSDPESAARFMLEAMSVSEVLANASSDTHAAVKAEVTAVLASHHRPDGVLMPAAAWLVTAAA